MIASALSPGEVVISNRGGGSGRRVPVVGVSVSWELSAPGSFSAFVQRDDLRAQGLGGSLQGSWLEWEHPTAGRWGGVINGRPITDGVGEIRADGWAALLRWRIVQAQITLSPGTGGGLARRVVLDAGTVEPTYITLGTIDEGGEVVAVSLGGGDVADDLLPQIANACGVEWRVDADRVFHVARKLGVDRSSTVRLVQDRHIASHHIADDLWVMPPTEGFATLSASATEQRIALQRRSAAAVTTSATTPHIVPQFVSGDSGSGVGTGLIQRMSEPLHGLADTRAFPPPPAWAGRRAGVGANHPAIPGPVGADPPTIPVELTLSDRDHCWAWWDIGDTIRIALNGFTGWFRPVVKALDVSSAAMTVAGEAMADG